MSDFSMSATGNGTQAPKTFAPYTPITKSYQLYTPSTIPINAPPNFTKNDSKNEEGKTSKYNNNLTGSQGLPTNGLTSKAESSSFKSIPTFLENRNVIMKGSMIAT